ncbi:MAG: DUF3775 domain-containing protein [Pseudomonadota bacterium]|nr:DUF3775 domain-containing protein [Pseudomonadota bacterium]MEC8668508.1 DUF3775 domain-containing protein [Pseudomonadota bacterium]
MLEITTRKVAQIILMARELTRAEGELRAFIENLNEDEAISLVALMWIGRGTFDAEELEDAKTTARDEADHPTADYLLGTPHLSDHLENGLDALGLSAGKDEDDLIRGG